MSLPWLANNVKQFIPLVKEQRIPHAILLSAPKGMGKIVLAKEMAQLAMCDNVSEKGVCHQCSACELLKAGNHTDLTVIKAEKAVIKVSQIRKLSGDVVLTSSKNQHKVIIIEEAEKMNIASANALLKTLEEPPKKVLIILTTNEMGRLLPTIRSRCVNVAIKATSHEIASQWLFAETKTKEEEIDFALFLSGNSPLLAKEILINNAISDVRAMVMDMEALKQQTVTLLDVSKKWFTNGWHLNLDYIALILLNQMAFQCGLKSFKIQNIESFKLNQNDNCLSFIKCIHRFNKRITSPLKIELQLEKLLMKWKE